MSLTSCLKNSPLSGADKAAIKALAKEYRENEGMAPNPAGIAAVQDTIDETLAERAEIGAYVEKRGGAMPDAPGVVAPAPVKAEPKKPAAQPVMAKTPNHLRKAGESLKAKAQEKLSQDRDTNTHRRASMAASAEAAASSDLALAETLLNLADAFDEGKIKHLTQLKSKIQVSTLDGVLSRARVARQKADGMTYSQTEEEKGKPYDKDDIKYAKVPAPGAHSDLLLTAAKALKNIQGGKLLARQIEGRVDPNEELYLEFRNKNDQEWIRKIYEKLKSSGKQDEAGWWFGESIKIADRVSRMGIGTDAEMRSALLEYVNYKVKRAKTDPIKQMERDLVGTKIPGFFPTPPAVLDKIMEASSIESGMDVLEPSAGMGNIADRIKAEGVNPDVVEVSDTLRNLLTAKGYDVKDRDFLEFDGEYDRILMNPPFEKGQDIEHVMHAFDLLKPDGRVVSVMSDGPFSREDKKSTGFRDWFSSLGGISEKLPVNSFTDKKEVRTTGVSTRMVIIDKSAKAEPKKPAAKKEGIHAKFIQELGIKKGSTLQFTRKFDYLKADTDYQVNQITDTEIFVQNAETGGQTNVRISVAKAQHKKDPLIVVKAPEAEQSKPDQKNITFSESKRAGKGLSVAEVEGFIAPVQLKRFSGPKVEVVPAVSSLTKSMQALIGNKNVDGVYDPLTKTVYLVAGNIYGERQARRVLDHESVGHYSMEEMLGDEFKPILDKVQQLKQAGDETVSDIAAEVLDRYGNLDAEIESREIIAVMAEKGINSPLMRRIYAAIQRFLRSVGINRMFTATELQGIVARAANELGRPRPGGKGKGGVSLSVSEAQPDKADDRISFSQPPPSDFEQENKRLREDDNKVWNKARKSLVRYFSPGGALPRQVFGEKITRDSEFEAVEFDVRHLVGKLERAVKQEYGKRFEALDDATVKNLSNALAGNSAPTIPESVRQEVYAMRQYIDKMSAQYATVLTNDANRLIAEAGFTKEEQQEISRIRQEEKDEATKEKLLREIRQKTGKANKLQAEAIQRAELLDTIRNNMGEYVHRSYKAFDDPKWFRKIPDDVINDAREYLTSRNVENGETQVEAERLAEQALNRIVKTDTAYDNMEAFIKEAKLGAKDLSILKKRKKIAPEIRALLGEQTDPRLNFAKSATKMGRLIWNQMFLERVRHLGMGSFFFEDKDAPPEATVQFAAEKNEVYSPLNGLWTTPEVEQAFRDALGKEQMEDWYRAIVRLNGIVKFGKTILSPTTAARNWQSAFFFTIANGHFDLSQMSKSISGFKEYFTQQGKAEQLEYLKELKRLGVVYDTPYAGEMMRLLADSKMEDMLQGKKGVAVATLEKSLELAQKFYQYGDDFWKIIGFENEKNMLMKHAGLTESEAKVEAAERIRNTYPTYSMVGRAIQSLRRFPLAGTFVSFPAEIIRTSINIMKYTAKDFKNPGMRPIAMRRIAGIAIVSGFAYALQEIMKTVIGVDDEEEEAVRQLAAPWQKNSNLVFTGRDEDGKLRYIDISFIDPYNYWKRPINAILRDQPWHKAGYDVIKETMAPFLGSDIAAGTIFEVLANKRSGSGSEIYSESDMPWEITKDIANHLRKALQPGIATNIERTLKAMDGEVSISGRKYSPFDEAMAWGGWRLSTLDPKTALYYRSFEFNDSKRDAMKKMNQALRNPNDVTDADLNSAYSLFSKLRVKAYNEMFRIVHASRKSGLSEIEVKRVLLRSGVARRDIHFLVKGKVPKWSPSSMMRKNARGKAEMLFSKEIADKITKRHNEVMRLSRQ